MKTIFFTNRERIEIGDDHIQYMTYLQKKLPAANYNDAYNEDQAGTPIKKKRSQAAGANKQNRYLSQHGEQNQKAQSLPRVTDKKPSIKNSKVNSDERFNQESSNSSILKLNQKTEEHLDSN